MGGVRGEWIGRSRSGRGRQVTCEECGEARCGKAQALAKQIPSGDIEKLRATLSAVCGAVTMNAGHGSLLVHGLVIVSSRFSSVVATPYQAANSSGLATLATAS